MLKRCLLQTTCSSYIGEFCPLTCQCHIHYWTIIKFIIYASVWSVFFLFLIFYRFYHYSSQWCVLSTNITIQNIFISVDICRDVTIISRFYLKWCANLVINQLPSFLLPCAGSSMYYRFFTCCNVLSLLRNMPVVLYHNFNMD